MPKNTFLTSILFAMPIAFSACKNRQSQSVLKLDASDVRFVTAKNPIPIAVKIKSLWGTCGGSIVSSDTILTAAHCISENLVLKDGVLVPTNKEERWCIDAGAYKGKCAVSAMVIRSWRAVDTGFEPNDVALLRFRPSSFSDYVAVVSPGKTMNAENVFLVGYSDVVDSVYDKTVRRLSKRWARTTKPLSIMLPTGPILRVEETFNDAEVDEGDSGGPMLNQSCEQIGVVSSQDREVLKPGSNFVDLNSQLIQEFFAEMARTAKAHVCGIPETPQAFCPDSIVLVPRSEGDDFPCARRKPHSPEHLARYFDLERSLGETRNFVIISSWLELGLKTTEENSLLKIVELTSSSPLRKYGIQTGWTISGLNRQIKLSSIEFRRRHEAIFDARFTHTNYMTYIFYPPLLPDFAQASTTKPAVAPDGISVTIFSELKN